MTQTSPTFPPLFTGQPVAANVDPFTKAIAEAPLRCEAGLIENEEGGDKLREAMDVEHIEIHDLTGSRDHYKLILVSSSFDGLLPIKQHRLIYGVLKEEMKGPIHALTIESYTPAQWAGR